MITQMSQVELETSEWEPKLIAFLCNWCSYAGADLAGSSRIQYPPNIRIIRVTCSGRVDPLLIFRAFNRGADGVLVAGCHPGDCHYSEGNYYMRRRLSLMKEFLGFLGIDPRRLAIEWIAASEGTRFAQVARTFTETVKALGTIKS